MLADIDSIAGILTPREVVLQAKQVYSACFYEVLRQVSVSWAACAVLSCAVLCCTGLLHIAVLPWL